jgi:hypothetical protein
MWKSERIPIRRGMRQSLQGAAETLDQRPILTIFDPEFESFLETDASDGAIAACLKQKGTDGKIGRVGFPDGAAQPADGSRASEG